ncbi:heparin lyase I family protein [Sulfitobacter sp. HNIBRBA3233]|uniref:heparin lyase I family protein n=1 Tax=Sulfitobacter marinivivus TaxID=3158558 RepID=UPI0032DE3838
MIRLRSAARVCAAMAIALLAGLSIGSSAARAGPYYLLDLEGSEIALPYLYEGTKRFHLRLEGATSAARAYDPRRGSNVLVLSSGPTPRGQTKDRAEVQLYGNLTYGREWFVGLSVMIPRDVPVPEDWQVLLQCHQNGTSTSPPVSLDLEPDGRLALIARNDADTFETLWSVPMPRGRWVQIELGLDMGPQGRVQLWVDGRRRADIRRALGWAAGQRACAVKSGIYRGASRRPFTVYLDDIMLGDTRADVLP